MEFVQGTQSPEKPKIAQQVSTHPQFELRAEVPLTTRAVPITCGRENFKAPDASWKINR